MTNDRILVVFASKHGATGELAEGVADALRGHSYDVDVMEAGHEHDVTPYRAVVIGCAVYMGRWRREVVHFLEENADDLQARDVWAFSSGPVGEHLDDEEAALPHRVQALLDAIGAHEHVSFAGKIDREQLGLPERMVVRVVGGDKVEGDWRDFGAVAKWADHIAETLGHPSE